MKLLFCADDAAMARYADAAAGFLERLKASFESIDCVIFTDAKEKVSIPFAFSKCINASSGMCTSGSVFRKFLQSIDYTAYNSFLFMLPHHLADEITLLALERQISCRSSAASASSPGSSVLTVPYLGSSAGYSMTLVPPFCVNLLSMHEDFAADLDPDARMPVFVPAADVPGIRRSFKAPWRLMRFAIIAGKRTGTNVHFHYMLSSIASKMKGEWFICESLRDSSSLAPMYEKDPWISAECAVFVGEDGSNSHVASLRRHKFTIVVNDTPFSPLFGASDAAFLCDCRDFIREFNSRLKKVNFRLKNSAEKRF